MRNLDITPTVFNGLLGQTVEMVQRQFEELDKRKAYAGHGQSQVEAWFDEALPQTGMDGKQLLDLVEERVLNSATMNIGPHMYGYVVSGGNQIGILAETLAATINQNVGKWHLAPAITEIDKRVIQWVSGMIGCADHVGGFLGSSGSSANLDGLTVARNIFFERQGIRKQGLFGLKPMTVYCSDETHSSIEKSVQLLGIGSDHMRKIPTNTEYKIDLNSLHKTILRDIEAGMIPFCIVGNAGTVNTGAIDDLNGLADLAKKYGLWFHVDGAYGGLVSSIETIAAKFEGMNRADSIALDFHKWLYQPFEVGCLLVKGWDKLKRSFFKQAPYLDSTLEAGENRLDFNDHHFMLSRNAKSLKVWMSIKYYGIRKLKEMIQKDIDLTRYLSDQIDQSDDFILKAVSPLGISCFLYKGTLEDPEVIADLNRRLIPALETDGRVFLTGTRLKGEFVLRACLINHRKTIRTIDYLLSVIRDVAETLL